MKYCFARDLKSVLDSRGLDRGNRNGDEMQMEDGPFSKELGSDRHPGFPTRSTKYSLHKNECYPLLISSKLKKIKALINHLVPDIISFEYFV